MAKRTYTPEQRTQALELHYTDGPSAASQATGIPKDTIASWARRAGVHTVCVETRAARVQVAQLKWEERRAGLAHRMGEIAAKALERVEHAIEGETEDGIDLLVPGEQGRTVTIRPSDAKALATTCAILVDKAQLLTGAVTSRHEHRHIDAIDAQLEDLAAQLETVPA